jgi:hypothetical protein
MLRKQRDSDLRISIRHRLGAHNHKNAPASSHKSEKNLYVESDRFHTPSNTCGSPARPAVSALPDRSFHGCCQSIGG